MDGIGLYWLDRICHSANLWLAMSSNASDSADPMAHRAVFLSYAREDTAAAQRLAEDRKSVV